ncbi:MAG: hypothetical protein KAT46_05035 [Deltaproteobacteria bacterium]|nr:hypothetical protein [Deltaproteobacteria bacterium]
MVQRVLEEGGIPTIGVTFVRDITEKTGVPRALFVQWPMGHPLGEPFNAPQHRTILCDALKAFQSIKEAGTIIDLPYKWKRHKYE